jgi:predicted TIM-barrel fold metal-dependent hydrolase
LPDETGLVDHHAHPVLAAELAAPEFGEWLTESDRPAAPGTDRFDSQLGFAVRRWCAPLLDLPPSASAGDYRSRRAELGVAEVNRRMLRACGISHYLVDTGLPADGTLSLPDMAELSGAAVREIVRLEQVAEQVAASGDGTASGFAGRFVAALAQRARHAVGVKSIVGYRHGLDFDPERPSPAAVTAAAGGWLAGIDAGARPRVTDPVLLRALLWAAVDLGLPIQLHTGFGDPDLDLRRCDPLLLRGFAERTADRGVPVMLLHCYPYHRQAGYLAHAYPHLYCDVGLAVHHVGARAAAVIAESLELAPFSKVLFSSDAWGPAELHFLGAHLWRRGLSQVLAERGRSGDWSAADIRRVAELTGAQNAIRVYGLDRP